MTDTGRKAGFADCRYMAGGMTRSAATGMWHRATHTAYYLSNAPITAETAADAIRAHWTIENTSHHSRDVTMREDASRIR